MPKATPVICLLLCFALLLAPWEAAAAMPRSQNFRVEQARRLALAASPEITKVQNEILLKRMKYTEAVKGIKAKVKNLRSFRWSPLLSFKFPEKLNLIEEYELNTKPLVLQTEITTLQHRAADLRYEVAARANKAYSNAFILQEKVTFTQEMLDRAQEDLARNQARLLVGQATQTDVDNMEKTVEKLTAALSQEMKNFENAKKQLSELVGLDVTTGYRFANPLREADLPRSKLPDLVEHTLLNDQTYYEARMTASVALLNLDSYEGLMRNQYGSKMDRIAVFLSSARNGTDIDYTAFKQQYDAMLTDLDAPWAGKIKILFFTFTMEWFKGEISGTRYIEDEMYAVYSACMEYAGARRDMEQAEKDLRKLVESSYESLITAQTSAEAMQKSVEDARAGLDKILALNKIGKAEYSEVRDKQDEYQSLQLEALDSLATYNELLWDFDRLTCGAVTALMTGAALGLDAGVGGDSYLEESPGEEPTYYIYTDVADMVFQFGVSIPQGYEPAMTHYEVYYEDTRLGSRTPVSQPLRHLALDYGATSTLTVRLFAEGTYVDECEVDTTVPHDVLVFKGGTQRELPTEETVGRYDLATTTFQGVSTSTLTLTMGGNAGEIAFYRVTYGEGTGLLESDKLKVDERFSYLTLLAASLEEVEITFYDAQEEELYKGRFDPADQTLKIPYRTPAEE